MPRFCTKCGAPLVEGARFCTTCGQVIEQQLQEAFPEQTAEADQQPTQAYEAVEAEAEGQMPEEQPAVPAEPQQAPEGAVPPQDFAGAVPPVPPMMQPMPASMMSCRCTENPIRPISPARRRLRKPFPRITATTV